MLKVTYSVSRNFKTLDGARRFAHRYVGPYPEIGFGYAVSGDGIGKVAVEGCTLSELFPEAEARAYGRWEDL